MNAITSVETTNPFSGLIERIESGMTILTPPRGHPIRRVLYVNSYGGVNYWNLIKRGLVPPHHLWGCLELVRMGYEVALAESLPDFYLYRKPFPHDLKLLKVARSWLGRDGIIYCGHNVLYWLPFLRRFGVHRCRIVSLLFAREPLDQSRAHSGVIALTRAAAEHARKLAPQAKVAHLGWGVDLRGFATTPYAPEFFLSCGRTLRDHPTLQAAATQTRRPLRVITSKDPQLSWPANVHLVVNDAENAVTFQDLLHEHYRSCAASLIILKDDPAQYTAVGMTNLIEAMAMARPVIVTRTGALPTEIDVEKTGCGLHVPPNDPHALAKAIDAIAGDPVRARKMGETGRDLCNRHYNIDRYARELHQMFEQI